MADDPRDDHDRTDSSLELPSLRSAFRRRPGAKGREKHADPARQDRDIAPSRQVTTRRAEAEAAPETEPAPEPEPVRRPRRRIRVHLPGWVAAPLVGAVVGLVLVGLTAGSLHLCTAMRGTDSCGKPGLLLLLAITAVAILLGSFLLRLAGVGPHGSAGFLGVGLLVVLVLLALLPVLDEWWVVIVVPVVSALTFSASWWLTTTYSQPGDRPH
jgi:hypothetical protein